MTYASKAVLYAAIRLDLRVGLFKRVIERKCAIEWSTAANAEPMLPEPLEKHLPQQKGLDIHKPFIDDILKANLDLPHSQHRTALWIYHRLLAEHGMQDIPYQLFNSYARERNRHLTMVRIATNNHPTA